MAEIYRVVPIKIKRKNNCGSHCYKDVPTSELSKEQREKGNGPVNNPVITKRIPNTINDINQTINKNI